MTAEEIIERLGLEELDHEGGFFKRIFTSQASVCPGGVERPAGTSIVFLVTPEDFSALHRLKQVEFYTHIGGDILELNLLDPGSGTATQVLLGPISELNTVPFYEVSADLWQGSRLGEGAEQNWALVSCTMSPGFEWSEFELGDRAQLKRRFPESSEIIEALTRI